MSATLCPATNARAASLAASMRSASSAPRALKITWPIAIFTRSLGPNIFLAARPLAK